MSVHFRRFISLFLGLCGLALIVRPTAALSSSSPAILINEFMPKPSSGSEWVELYNPNPFEVDLSGWKIGYLVTA